MDALEAELRVMQQRMHCLVSIARGAALEEQQGARGQEGGAVLSLLGVLNALEAAHLQQGPAGKDTRLQRVRLLQVQMGIHLVCYILICVS